MNVTVKLTDGVAVHNDVLQAGPTGNGQYFGVVRELKEEATPSGLVVRVSGGKRHHFYPTARVIYAEIEE